MKQALLFLSAIVLFGSMALAQTQNQNQNGNRPRYAATEDRAIGMLGLSAGVITGGLVLKRRRSL